MLKQPEDLSPAHAIKQAWLNRTDLFQHRDSNAFRIFHGFEEGIEGVIIEKLGDVAIIQFKRDIRDIADEIVSTLLSLHPFTLIIAKGHQSLKMKIKQRVFVLHGQVQDEQYWATEFGINYLIDPQAIHNCGLYIDARPVREWIRTHSENRRVLNLFSFTGSLGLAASVGGAKSVAHIDKTAALLAHVRDNFKKNNQPFDNRDLIQGDIYRHLPKAIKAGRKFDGIILDPPPKVYKSGYARNKPQGQDFSQLVGLCKQLLNPNGWLITMFHRFEKTWDEFELEVMNASDGTLLPKHRMLSDQDFPETDERNKLRVSIFVCK